MSASHRWTRTDCSFLSAGERCRGWLYRPQHQLMPPIVVMAHGFAAERTFGLPAFAEHFAAHGLAVLLFDYRHFGESDGLPRECLSIGGQLADWQAAVNFARTLPQVDARRLAIWGTSLSGGHALVTAARNADIAAVVAQTPMVDVLASLSRFGPRYWAAAVSHGLWDALRSVAGLPPHYVPVVAQPNQFAALPTMNCETGYRGMTADCSTWPNRCTARSLLELATYRPLTSARQIRCPAFLALGWNDQLVPPRTVLKTADRIPGATLVELPCDHFQVYHAPFLNQLLAQQTDFLRRALAGDSVALPRAA